MRDDLNLIKGAIDFIEANLKEKLSVDQIAEVAGFSKYHFTRVFTSAIGMSPYDYYRGRKVTETINFIKIHDCRIIDAAFEYGFSSPEVFVRACRAVFDLSPSKIRIMSENDEFEGVTVIDDAFIEGIRGYSFDPILRFMPELELYGIGYFTNKKTTTLSEMSDEWLDSFVSGREIYKVSWVDRDMMGYMNFVGQLLSDQAQDARLLKHLPRMSYLDFDIPKKMHDRNHYIDYIIDRYIQGTEYELAIGYHVETFNVTTSQGHLYVPVIPKK